MKTNETSCIDVLDRLPLHVGGDLDPTEALLVQAHIGRCGPCAGEARRLEVAQEHLRGALRAPASEIADPRLWGGIRATLLAEGRIGAPSLEVTPRTPITAERPRFQLLRRVGAVAAAAALLAVGSLVGFGTGERPGAADPAGSPAVDAGGGMLVRNELEQPMRPVAPGEESWTRDAVLFVPQFSDRKPVGPAIPVGAPGGASLVSNGPRPVFELR